MVHANLLTRLVRLTCRMPRLICTAHSTNEGGKLRMLAYRLTAPLADLSTNVSSQAVAAFETQGAAAPGSMRAIPNGIDIQSFSKSDEARQQLRNLKGVREAEKVIVAVGRLNVAKDYPNLINAFNNLLKTEYDVRLWIIGDGELREDLEIDVASRRISDKVEFLGVQRNVADWMNAADVFVLSSAWEGFGLVVAEAMACQKVVVATDAGGVKEVLGDCGILVPVRDSKALSKALQVAVHLPRNEAALLGLRARQRVVDNYSLEHVVERWLEIYKS